MKTKLDERQFKMSYNAIIRRIDNASGDILDEERIHNLVVNDGLERMAQRMISNSNDFFDVLAIGTGTNVATNADTQLQTEVIRDTATVSYVASYKAQFVKLFTFGSGESYNITECGIFDGLTPSGSTMFNRLVFTPKAVDADTSLSVTITITFARA